jgi:hypothetical protein
MLRAGVGKSTVMFPKSSIVLGCSHIRDRARHTGTASHGHSERERCANY